MKYLLSDIASIVSGELHGLDTEIQGISTDSRSVSEGHLFVALEGEKFDGHDFIEDALQRGARAALTSRPTTETFILVNDPLKALGEIAQHYRTTLSAKVIAITGSNGKTSTKDLLACALRPFGTVIKSDKSLNNEIGVPLTIFQADASTDFLILEMGMRGLGQIKYLTEIAMPQISLLLNAGTAHLSELGSRENIVKAKSEIFLNMTTPKIAITSADDERLVHIAKSLEASIYLFGQSESADVRVTQIRMTPEGFPSANIGIGDQSYQLTLPRVGEHQILNAAAVVSVIHALSLEVKVAISALETCQDTPEWRMEIVELNQGITIINDAYNANPDSVRAGLKALKDFAQDRRSWAVLGEMREIGESSLEEHDAIGRLCVRLDVSKTLAVGEPARSIQLGASHEGSWNQEAMFVSTVDDAIALLRDEILPGDVVFIKASRAVGLERVAKALEEHFGRKNRLS
jgi:UDP-N-acetylmuramoyl-tripeptide--D-alanyl-D-alanine ligase